MTQHAPEFIRRLSLHILPKGFVRIWHYGILSSTSKADSSIIIKDQLPVIKDQAEPKPQLYNPLQCPCCKKETMHTILQFNRRRPPQGWEETAKNILECVA